MDDFAGFAIRWKSLQARVHMVQQDLELKQGMISVHLILICNCTERNLKDVMWDLK